MFADARTTAQYFPTHPQFPGADWYAAELVGLNEAPLPPRARDSEVTVNRILWIPAWGSRMAFTFERGVAGIRVRRNVTAYCKDCDGRTVVGPFREPEQR